MKFTKNSENEYLSHITIGAGVKDSYTEEWIDGDGNTGTNEVDTSGHKVKVYLNPYDDSFEKSKMILLEETNSITLGTCTNINLNQPIEIAGDKFSLVFEFGGNITGNILDIVDFKSSQTADGERISGNLYSSFDFDSIWELENGEFPVYAFTINKTISKISVKNPPNKTVYVVGENFDKTGMVIMVEYSDGTSKEITNYIYTPSEALKVTDEKITISYTEGNVTKTVEQDITVINAPQSNTEDNKEETGDDSVTPEKELPNAGVVKNIVITLIVLVIVSVTLYYRYNKYKNI